jgi:transcription antitermination factor NusG
METKKLWYVVYTRSKWEKKVAALLTKKGIENYCPLVKVIKQWADRKKKVEEPLFNSYVFVHVDESEHLPIKQTDGIVNFVYWLGKPAVVKEEEIEAIQKYITNSYTVSLEKTKVNVNDTVRITNGPLIQQEGNVMQVQSNSVKVLLPSLGYAIIAVETGHVEKIKPQTQTFKDIRQRSMQLLHSVLTLNFFHASFR